MRRLKATLALTALAALGLATPARAIDPCPARQDVAQDGQGYAVTAELLNADLEDFGPMLTGDQKPQPDKEDCDGGTDEGAACTNEQVGYAGVCRDRCRNNECSGAILRCTGVQVGDADLDLCLDLCLGVPCEGGLDCDSETAACVERRADVPCPVGQLCEVRDGAPTCPWPEQHATPDEPRPPKGPGEGDGDGKTTDVGLARPRRRSPRR